MTFLLLHDPQASPRKENIVKDVSDILIPKDHRGRKTAHLGGVCVGKPAPHVEIRINTAKKGHFGRRMGITGSVTATKEIEPDPSISPGR